MADAQTRIDPQDGLRLVVAGGGTGGHLFPGIAVAQAFVARNAKNRVLFINSGRPLEKKVLSGLGWDQAAIAVQGLKGRGLWRQLRVVAGLPAAVLASARLIKGFGADLVFGVGGYSAGPVVAAAWLMGRPTAIHEQNQLPGITNRMLGRLVKRVYVSFDSSKARFDIAKVMVSGNPVRDEIRLTAESDAAPGGQNSFTIFIVGGSQGARAINEAVMGALPELKGIAGLSFVHQTGEADETRVRQAYRDNGIQADVGAFFNDMAGRYSKADLIVCRAGATTVAEIAVIGKAAVFVPFPFAADDHQTRNAQALVEAGAARMLEQAELSGQRLADLVVDLMEEPGKLTEMASRARALGRPDAARDIVDDLYALAGMPPADGSAAAVG